MEKKFRTCIWEKGVLDLTNIIIDPLFIKEIKEHLNNSKLKPPPINFYNRTKDPVNHAQSFQFTCTTWEPLMLLYVEPSQTVFV